MIRKPITARTITIREKRCHPAGTALSLCKRLASRFWGGTGNDGEIKKRITPPSPLLASLVLTGFLVPQFYLTENAWSQNAPNSAEIIVCPENKTEEANTPLDAYYLGRAYDKGYCGFAVDKKQAESWYIKSAEQGHMLARYQLGEMYFSGAGATPDYPKAKKWYMAAAEQGYGPAQLRLGFLFAEAHFAGLSTDYKEAEKWFLRAAEQNAGDAQFRLGNFYHNYKTPPDMDKAILWLTRAAEGGHRIAMFDLSRLLKDRKDHEQALFWMKKSAELDLLPAQMSMSTMYAEGNGVPKDPQQSLYWTLKIATRTASPPVYWINKAADIYFAGWETIPKDYAQALKFYEAAAAKNDPHALSRLGRMYQEGLGVAADSNKAHEYLRKAAELGDKEANDLLNVKGTPHDAPAQK